jgi:hypothetical protein
MGAVNAATDLTAVSVDANRKKVKHSSRQFIANGGGWRLHNSLYTKRDVVGLFTAEYNNKY